MLTCYGLLLVMWCAEPAPRAPTPRCPPIVQYDSATQKRAADELRRLPATSPVRRLVTDYGNLRAKCRAYEGEK